MSKRAATENEKMLTTTLNRIRVHHPCESGWRKLLLYLKKSQPDDEPLPYATIVASNGLDDALWCCRAEPQYAQQWRLFAVWCARRVQHLMTDPRSVAALDVAERYANGEATNDDLAAALAAVWDAALDPALAASWAAARDAEGAAAWDAAGAAALDAAWAAARAAARDAGWAAARAAAWDAARAAAWDAVRDGAGDAALDAARAAARAAAWDAAWDAVRDGARAAARDAAGDAQRAQFLRIVGAEAA